MSGIRVKILTNEIGAFYDDAVWTRFLKVEATNGNIYVLFDPDVISTGLEVGKEYTLLVSPLTAQNAEWEMTGEVIDDNFTISSNMYRKMGRISAKNRLLVETEIGMMILQKRDFPNETILSGKKVSWHYTRIDLIAFE